MKSERKFKNLFGSLSIGQDNLSSSPSSSTFLSEKEGQESVKRELGFAFSSTAGKMGLDLLGLGFGNEKLNWDGDCLTRQYREFLYFPHLNWDF